MFSCKFDLGNCFELILFVIYKCHVVQLKMQLLEEQTYPHFKM